MPRAVMPSGGAAAGISEARPVAATTRVEQRGGQHQAAEAEQRGEPQRDDRRERRMQADRRLAPPRPRTGCRMPSSPRRIPVKSGLRRAHAAAESRPVIGAALPALGKCPDNDARCVPSRAVPRHARAPRRASRPIRRAARAGRRATRRNRPDRRARTACRSAPSAISSRCPPTDEAATSLPCAIASSGFSGVTSSVSRLALRG